MKRSFSFVLPLMIILISSHELFPQSPADMQEFGITTGGFSNFPANKNYLKDYMSVVYLAPYIRTGNHEFSLGISYPLAYPGLYFDSHNLKPYPGAIINYKFYIFNVYGRENMFIHYSFEYLRFNGSVDTTYASGATENWKETDTYINNVIGLGYNLFLDTEGRFGFYYILDYLISQGSYKLGVPGSVNHPWTTEYIWNNLSNQFGFIFKITSLKKKGKK
jgi:hypothetical protein